MGGTCSEATDLGSQAGPANNCDAQKNQKNDKLQVQEAMFFQKQHVSVAYY